MDGGCLDIWLKEATSDKGRVLLQDYAKYVGHLGWSFSLEHRDMRIGSKFEEGKIFRAIGYIPKEVIVVCGFADFIFQAAEEILSHYEGYLRCTMPDEEYVRFQSQQYRIKVYKSGDSRYRRYDLLTRATVKGYYNLSMDKTVCEICSLKKFLNRDLTFSN